MTQEDPSHRRTLVKRGPIDARMSIRIARDAVLSFVRALAAAQQGCTQIAELLLRRGGVRGHRPR